MPATSRSIAVSVLTNLHIAFDTERCRTHTAWAGRGLHLLGPQYSLAKRPFISTNDIPVLWTMPPRVPWATAIPVGKTTKPTLATVRYRAVSSKGGVATFIYDLKTPAGETIAVHESPRGLHVAEMDFVIRRIEVGPGTNELSFAAHSDFGRVSALPGPASGFLVSRTNGTHLITFIKSRSGVEISTTSRRTEFTEEVFTEVGAEKGNPTVLRKGRLATGWVRIPPRKKAMVFEVITFAKDGQQDRMRIDPNIVFAAIDRENMSFPLTGARDRTAHRPEAIKAGTAAAFSMASTGSYRAEAFPIPRELELLVTGMDFLPGGDLAVCTWLGDIFIIRRATGNVREASYVRFATGLCEPMGLVVKDGEIYVGLKTELARVTDTDNSGTADLIERLNADWGYTGHYNSFSYGPVIDGNGNFVLANAGHSGRWDAKYMGWAFSINAMDSRLSPICHGFREPNGIGVFGPDRDVFISDNQGSWIGSCRLDHVSAGKFHGHPSAWPAKKEEYGKHTSMDPPAVWFPYKLARSTTDILEIPDDKFGPFKGQLLVGDFQNAIVMRVMLEKIDGEYQGAVWPFLKRFQSGVNRMAFGPDGNLYVGGCQRTWASIASKEAAIERVKFSGKIPFEVKNVHVKPDGFELTFTKPVDAGTAGDPEAYDMLQYRLKYHQTYGSPEYDHAGKKDSASSIEITDASVSADRLKVRLKVAGWKTGYVTMVRSLDLRDANGNKLVNNTFWYTLNRLPKS